MARYGSAQSPKFVAPEIDLHLLLPDNSKRRIRAIADTGSPITCLPHTILKDLKAFGRNSRPGRVRGPVGRAVEVRIYYVNLHCLDCDFNAHEVGIIERDYALIGRDILNNYYVNFKGPKKLWYIHKKDDANVAVESHER